MANENFFLRQKARGRGYGNRAVSETGEQLKPNQKCIIANSSPTNSGKVGYFQFIGAGDVVCLTDVPKVPENKHNVYFIAKREYVASFTEKEVEHESAHQN